MAYALGDELFGPLDLDEVLDEAFEEAGLEGLVELMEAALADQRAEGDPGLAGYLDELAEHYGELGRYADAIATARRIIAIDPEQRVDELIWIAEMQARTGAVEEARELLHSLRSEHEAKSEWDRDLWQGLSAAVVLGDEVGDHSEAAEWLADDIRTGIRTKVDADLVKALDNHRRRLAALAIPPLADPPLDRQIEAYAADNARQAPAPNELATAATELVPPTTPALAVNRPRNQVRMGYLPEAEFATARARGLVEQVDSSHAEHRREIELAMRQTPPGSQRVVPVTVEALVTFAEDNALDPATPYARLRLAEALPDPGILWPPDRNDPCWCGSGAKYKKCCRTF